MSTKTKKSRKSVKKITWAPPPVPKPELHRLAFTAASLNMVSIPNTWRETDLCGSIQAGGAFYNRVGSKISVRSVRWRGVIAGGATGAGGIDEYYNSLRMVIFTHRHPKVGALITPLATAGITGSASFSRDYIPGLGQVLIDRMVGITNQPYGANLCAPGTREFNYFHVFPGRGLEIQFSGNGTGLTRPASLLRGHLRLWRYPNPGMIIGLGEITWYDL